MTAVNRIPSGYKQTEVGVIPEDWEIARLGELFCFKNGLNKEKEFFGYGTPIVNYMDVFRHPAICASNLNGRVFLSKPEIKNFDVRKGDVFFTRTSETTEEIGITSVMIDEPTDTVFSGFLLRARPFNQRLDDEFKAHCFSSKLVRKQIVSKASYTTRALTNGGILSQVLLPTPQLPEQRAIATALSDVDALLAAQDKLIAKKRDIKQATMQQLLTGKQRLPGFNGEWKKLLLGDVISSCSSGATPYRGHPENYKGTVKWITSGELNYNVIDDTIEHISNEAAEKTNLKVHPAGVFLMAITGLEAAGTRGACGIVGSPATTNQSCMALYPTNELSTAFLFHYYVLRGDELALKYCQGTKQQSYTAKIVKLLPIDLPPTIKEQTAIAAVLSDMDADLAALEQQRDKTCALKQGMMQVLLTGRIRLV